MPVLLAGDELYNAHAIVASLMVIGGGGGGCGCGGGGGGAMDNLNNK